MSILRLLAPIRGASRVGTQCSSLALLLVALAPTTLTAQRNTFPVVTTIDSMRADGSVVTVPIRTPTPAFQLFAAQDYACAAYRSTGQLTGGAVNVRGPVGINMGGGCVAQHLYGNRTGYVFFEMGLAMASPPHEHRKIRAVHPGASSMRGSYGYNANWQQVVTTPNRTVIDAADGQFGKSFSGVTIAFDEGCRDDRDFFQQGFALLAMKDCPVTWGTEGYDGKRHVPDSVFRSLFAANPTAFNWNEFAIPRSRLANADFAGAQSFYGYMSDYSREIRQRYGMVVPGGTGLPTESGYPLGIEMRVDGWQFSAARVRNSQFYQITLVNKSKDLYGTPIDYDSLYYGLNPGFIMGGGHVQAIYYDIPRNTMHVTRQGTSGRCSPSYPRRYAGQTAGCQSTAGFSGGVGIYSITWLKSPIGDHRNKLFTDPSSPYYAPAHPMRGDTINFNHAMFGAFGNTPIAYSMRSAFGALSGVERAVLDDRTPAQLGAGTYLLYFTPEEYFGLPSTENARLNKFVPSTTINPKTGVNFGSWDYNHDGVPDTISVPGCGRHGCHALWSDTNPGGYRQQYGIHHNSLSTGPFSLGANDTAQFIWAFTWSPDTIEHERRINSLLDAYLTNWTDARPIPFPAMVAGQSFTVESAELRDSLSAGPSTTPAASRVTIRLPRIDPIDPQLLREVARIREDSVLNVGRTRLILRLNPGLLTRLEARARDNLAEVLVFKSCDGGSTFTTGGSATEPCTPAPTRNVGNTPLPFAWQPLRIVSYTNGSPAVTSVVDDVKPARSYLYSMVTRTRGFRDFAVIDSGAGGIIPSDVESLLGLPRDTINSPLATGGGTTISVYAPVTDAGNRVYARVDTATLGGRATQGVQFTNVRATASGTTRLVFANRFIVRKTVDTITKAVNTSVIAQYIIPSAVLVPGDVPANNFVSRSQTFSAAADIPVRIATGLLAGTLRSTSGASRVFVDTVSATANFPGYVWVTSDNQPIYVTTQPYNSNFETDQLLSSLSPGFAVRPMDSANVSTGFRRELVEPSGVIRDRHFIIRKPGDTLQTGAMQFSAFVQPVVAAKRGRGGSYNITWDTDPWGPGAPFTIETFDQLQAAVTASLVAATARASTITVVDEEIGRQVGATDARPLVRVRVPFSMTFTDTESGALHPVRFAMLARTAFPNNTRLLGSGDDTMRVVIPDSIWLPGDTLYAVHTVHRDSTVMNGSTRVTVVEAESINGLVSYRPIRVPVDSVGLHKMVIACSPTATGVRPIAFERTTCNPVRISSFGATPDGGYLPVAQGWQEYFELTRTFDPRSQVALTAMPFATNVAPTKASLERVRVVPNPYVVQSDMDDFSNGLATSRIWFTGLPPQGVLRVYSISGEWVQELKWTASDLTYQGNVTVSGDLPYNLKTRTGNDLASGLYLYVITATGDNGSSVVHRGKFVIIR